MTDAEREARIRQTYRGLQGDMPPFGDVLTLLRLLDEARALAAAPPQAPPSANAEREAQIRKNVHESGLDGACEFLLGLLGEARATSARAIEQAKQAASWAIHDIALPATPGGNLELRTRIAQTVMQAIAATAPPQAPPGASAMESARDICQGAGAIGFTETVAHAIEQAEREARAAERERCLRWAAGSAHTAEYVVNAIESGWPPLATVGEP